MKKLLYLVLAVAVMGLAIACGSKSGPGAAAKQYMEAVAAGDYDQFLNGTYFGEISAEEIESTRQMWKQVLGEGPLAADKEGVAAIEILSETVSEEGSTADVVFKRTYGNGETEEESLVMVLVDGTWLMDANQ